MLLRRYSRALSPPHRRLANRVALPCGRTWTRPNSGPTSSSATAASSSLRFAPWRPPLGQRPLLPAHSPLTLVPNRRDDFDEETEAKMRAHIAEARAWLQTSGRASQQELSKVLATLRDECSPLFSSLLSSQVWQAARSRRRLACLFYFFSLPVLFDMSPLSPEPFASYPAFPFFSPPPTPRSTRSAPPSRSRSSRPRRSSLPWPPRTALPTTPRWP